MGKLSISFLMLICTVSAVQDIHAQDVALRSESNLVLVPTLVRDQTGSPVFGLKAQDFLVEDNGIDQSVNLDNDTDTQPISIVVAIQTGRTAEAEFKRIKDLNVMLEPMLSSGRTEVAIVRFDTDVILAQKFSRDPAAIAAALASLHKGSNGAAIVDAITYSVRLLSRTARKHQRIFLLISETRDHGSITGLDDAIAAVGVSNTIAYCLAFSPTISNILDTMKGANEDKMEAPNLAMAAAKLLELARQGMRRNTPKTLASLTGGEYELFKSKNGFEAKMADFADHVFGRYTLSFVPSDPSPGLHQIRVRLKYPVAGRITARSRYWAQTRN